MCDYSLEMYNRIDAAQGETYTIARFATGTVGVTNQDMREPDAKAECAVCIKENSVVTLEGIGTGVFAKFDGPPHSHRDGVRFEDGTPSTSLQTVASGTRITIVMVAAEAPEDAALTSPAAEPFLVD